MRKIVCLLGPTASGKTALSIELARKYPIEIINVDSAQIYQGMEIGTGMPDKATRAQIPHHLIDFLDPKIPYSAHQFKEDALVAIKDILSRQKIPLLVGGTMYYFKTLQEGLAPLPASEPVIRQMLNTRLQEEGLASLYKRLSEIDLETATRLAPTDSQRILRALEIYVITQKNMSYWLSKQEVLAPEYDYINVALIPLTTKREVLHQRIEQRFAKMLEEGLIAEVEKLKARGDLDLSYPSLRAVGYRQVWQYLHGDISFTQMQAMAVAATRQLAKRQLTWLRHWGSCINLDFMEEKLEGKISDLL